MHYTIAQDSRIGGRRINQDRAAWRATEDAVLMVVADGLGGHLQGEVAAQLAIDSVTGHFLSEAKTRLDDPARFLALTLDRAHQSIVRYAAECRIPPHAAPRTTCIVCVVQDGRASWAHAGDSRLYLIHGQSRGPARAAQTRDHSFVQRMIDEGSISQAEAASHPEGHYISRCLGTEPDAQAEFTTEDVAAGDLFLLCTDGLHGEIKEAEILAALQQTPRPAPLALNRPNSRAGALANLTFLIVRF